MLTPNDTLSRKDRAILAMTPKDIARFWRKVDKTPGQGPKGECWGWTGGKDRKGYGYFYIDQMTFFAHRVAWFLEYGQLPPPETPNVLHHCDNPPCSNPGCLWAGTHGDNLADMTTKGRRARGDRSGSRVHPERLSRGERHYKARLTTPEVEDIRARWLAKESSVKIAAEYRVHPTTVQKIGASKNRARG